jgi:hypothetical protein
VAAAAPVPAAAWHSRASSAPVDVTVPTACGRGPVPVIGTRKGDTPLAVRRLFLRVTCGIFDGRVCLVRHPTDAQLELLRLAKAFLDPGSFAAATLQDGGVISVRSHRPRRRPVFEDRAAATDDGAVSASESNPAAPPRKKAKGHLRRRGIPPQQQVDAWAAQASTPCTCGLQGAGPCVRCWRNCHRNPLSHFDAAMVVDAGRTTSLAGLARSASVEWATEVTLRGLETSREARSIDYHARVQLERLYAETLTRLAPCKEDVVYIGANYRWCRSVASSGVRRNVTADRMCSLRRCRGAGNGYLQFVRWLSQRRRVVLVDECLTS